METSIYLDKFEALAGQLTRELPGQGQLQCKAGMWLNSAVLKIQRTSWLNPSAGVKPFEESIFFSLWISEASLKENRLYYNIHALKLRELSAYVIKSREFAEAFRKAFKAFEKRWPNVRTDFGPLTLMEGWIKIPEKTFEKDVLALARQFLDIEFIINGLLEERRKVKG
ncbi:hypothetical protein [Pedobacter nutrimenti]|uniref:Uncharacterized protein n=1 Tax=Pedobacter nutrimenti TaxID=1241337 RepID=A0A318UIK7_9SPHI|nr:hypothetical protein [Pedobacter nutrimenti]PYF75147.1 hypothetical protein B0O44_103596 [Pedobacter nutrimenti]